MGREMRTVYEGSRFVVLTPQAKHGRSCNVGVMNVPGNQSAEIVSIFACTAATALMKQELDSIDIGEEAVGGGTALLWKRLCSLSRRLLSLLVAFRDFCHLAPINWRSRKP